MSAITLKGIGGKAYSVPLGLFINNQFSPARGGETFEVFNPATGENLGSVSAAQKADIDAAVIAAQTALRTTWSRTTAAQRGQLLHRLADLIERDAEELASIEAIDAGILFGDSKNMHVPQAIETLRYFAGWADKVTGQALDISDGFAYTRREPLGVCAAIVPWNAPLYVLNFRSLIHLT